MFGNRLIEKIEPTAYIDPKVKMGKNNYIGHGVVIEGNVHIGDNNYIGHHCVIGVKAQNVVHRYEINDEIDCAESIVIGSNNVIREFSTVHRPMDTKTSIGNYCYLMAYSHISHDTQLSDRVILANNVQIGGYTHIHPYANVGLSSVIHQFTTIGSHAMIGMGTVISKDVPPFIIALGAPIQWSNKINNIGLERNGFKPEEITSIIELYKSDATEFNISATTDQIHMHLEAFKKQTRRKSLYINAAFEKWLTSAKSIESKIK